MPNNPPSLESLSGIIRRLEGQVATLAARTPRPEAQQSLYDALPKGIVGTPFVSAANDVSTVDKTTDMVVTDIDVLDTRNYEIVFYSRMDVSGAADWAIELFIDGTRFTRLFHYTTIGALSEAYISNTFLWQPATGTSTLQVRTDEAAPGGDLTLAGSATQPRQLYVKDIGARWT